MLKYKLNLKRVTRQVSLKQFTHFLLKLFSLSADDRTILCSLWI